MQNISQMSEPSLAQSMVCAFYVAPAPRSKGFGLAPRTSRHYNVGMSTLAEIEAAVETLPRAQQQELLTFLAEKVGRSGSVPADGADAFAGVIGAFAGPREATGRKAEEIL